MGSTRGHRRTAAWAAAIGLAIAACSLVAASDADAALVFKRPNGSVIRMAGEPQVWCGPWDQEVIRRTIHVRLRGPKRGWELDAVQADVNVGRRLKFPSSVLGHNPHGAILFAYQLRPLIEASNNEEEAKGFMVFSRAGCELGAPVAFTIHAVLGSELFEGTKVRVNGTFEGTVAEEPVLVPAQFAE